MGGAEHFMATADTETSGILCSAKRGAFPFPEFCYNTASRSDGRFKG
jgi:hypothetical protein